jgi:hypothetical protein
MAKTKKAASMFTARRHGPGLLAEVADVFHSLAKGIYDPYRPELHYMRGPGPKWHAKHRPTTVAGLDPVAMPALARVRVKG